MSTQAKAKKQKEVDAAMAEHQTQAALLVRKEKEVELLYQKVCLLAHGIGQSLHCIAFHFVLVAVIMAMRISASTASSVR